MTLTQYGLIYYILNYSSILAKLRLGNVLNKEKVIMPLHKDGIIGYITIQRIELNFGRVSYCR